VFQSLSVFTQLLLKLRLKTKHFGTVASRQLRVASCWPQRLKAMVETQRQTLLGKTIRTQLSKTFGNQLTVKTLVASPKSPTKPKPNRARLNSADLHETLQAD